MKRRGFTLIEMLVVIAITAVLAAIAVAVFGRVRTQARLSACSSNLHQLYLACAQYAGDNESLLPPYTSRAVTTRSSNGTPVAVEQSRQLLASLQPYTHDSAIWMCPADGTSYNAAEISDGLPVPHVTSYNYHGWRLGNQGGVLSYRIDASTRAAGAAGYKLLEDVATCPNDGGTQNADYNHGGRWNLVFFDGHIQTFALDCSNAPTVVEIP